MRGIAIALAALWGMSAQADPAQTEGAQAALTHFTELCGADGPVDVEPGAFTAIDLHGDGAADDVVIDFNAIMCRRNLSLWHGSGGSMIFVSVDGKAGDALRGWSGGQWRLTDFDGFPVLLIAQHGSWCDGYGASPCFIAVAGGDGVPRAVNAPEAMEIGQ